MTIERTDLDPERCLRSAKEMDVMAKSTPAPEQRKHYELAAVALRYAAQAPEYDFLPFH